MVQKGAEAEEVMAYLVLVRGTSARSKGVTTHGANSIATRSGMTYYSAEQALDWLASGGYIQKIVDDTDQLNKKWKGQVANYDESGCAGIGPGQLPARWHRPGQGAPTLEPIYNNASLGKHLVMAHAGRADLDEK